MHRVSESTIQLAAMTGAHVTALVRDISSDTLLRRLGAKDVVDLAGAARSDPYDLIIDGVGGAVLGSALHWLRPRGMCVQLGDAAGDQMTTFDAKRFRLNGGGLFGGTTLYGLFLLEELTRPDPIVASPLLQQLAANAVAGKLDPIVSLVRPWEEIDSVARAYLRREFHGKAVLRIS